MKFRTILGMGLIAVLSSLITWRWTSRTHPASHSAAQPSESARKIKFYQSPMHPWITSPKPGKCTVCGMDLVAVYEGDSGFEEDSGLVHLGASAIQVMNVQTGRMEKKPLRKSLRVAGTIEDDDTRHRFVSATVDGRIERLIVNYVGAEVEAGKPLAAYFSPALLQAERDYVLLTRSPAGLGSPNLIESARTRLRRMGLNDEAIAALANKPESESTSLLLAPVSGTVVNRFVYEGQYVKEGDKLFETADFSTMWFKFDVYEKDLPWLREDQEVEIFLPSLPGKAFSGKVRFLDPNANEMTRSLKARVEIPNPLVEEGGHRKRVLLHRVFAEAIVRVEIPVVHSVPRSAVLASGLKPLVYVEKERGAYLGKRVELGRVGDDDWEILSGLEEDDRIVVHGNLLIDAQAQLNHIATGAMKPDEGSPPPDPDGAATNQVPRAKLEGAAADSLEHLIGIVTALGEALAADDLNRFNQLVRSSSSGLHARSGPLRGLEGWEDVERQFHGVAAWVEAKNLADARKNFHSLAVPIVDAARAGVRQGILKPLKIYRCPMTRSSFPGAPKWAEWIQAGGPIRNPYFGAEMLDCGTEVAP